MTLTPRPLFLTPRLCVPIQLRSSLLTCQGALSQIKTKTFLPIPRTKRNHVRPSSGKKSP